MFLKVFLFSLGFGFVLFLPIGLKTLAKHCDFAGGCCALNQSTAAEDKQNPEPAEFWVFFLTFSSSEYCAKEGNQQSLPCGTHVHACTCTLYHYDYEIVSTSPSTDEKYRCFVTLVVSEY